MDAFENILVEALGKLSPLARTKIRATLEDATTEITWGEWAKLFGRYDPSVEPRPCGCLMMDGYFKEHPPTKHLYWSDDYHTWSLPNDEWIGELIPFYEMQTYEGADLLIGGAANAYDNWIKARRRAATKTVRGIQVLRVPARRRLITLVDKAST